MTALPLAIAVLTLFAIAVLGAKPYVIRLALTGYVLLWLIWPFAYRLIADVDPIGDDIVQWYRPVALAHAISVAVTVLIVLCVRSPFTGAVRQTRLARWRIREGILLALLVVFGCAILAARLWQFRSGGDFVGVAALNISRDRASIGGFTLVSAAATAYMSLALGTLASDTAASLRTRLMSWVCVTIVAGQVVLMGQRTFMLLPVWGLFLLAGTTTSSRRRQLWLAAWATAAVALVAIPVGALVVGVTRSPANGDEADAAERALELLGGLGPSERARVFMAAVNVKFDDISTGATLLALDGVGGGGFRPLTSALLSPIPRLLLPSKPVPISANGDQSGVPFVRAASQYGAIDAGMVVPVSPAAIAVWELGWSGLAIFVAANVLALWLVEAWLSNGSILPGAFAFSMLSYPSFEFTLQSPSSLVRDLLRLAIAWVLLSLVAIATSDAIRPSGPVGSDG